MRGGHCVQTNGVVLEYAKDTHPALGGKMLVIMAGAIAAMLA
ncbi:hypothetical protein FHS14_002699 [Paenibacillus baekrokdamisoli]|nr:hypothetical protein [Paenibacillus baekrokdamisoli]MBB3069704.1 hypothetical protein [Paenibacillus baekrokdamisoli]